MKFSYQWLLDLVPGLSTEPAELQRLITMKTAECEGIESVGAHFASVIAARVLSISPLPKGKNQAVSIDIGGGKQVSVVCGAPNVQPGMLAAWVPPGTTLGDKVIGRAVIEGVASEGMLASAAELGINRDHSGLLVLSGLEAGEPLPRLHADFIIEIDNKSLTHRPDLWGHRGLAREVGAITGNTLTEPAKLSLLPQSTPHIRVEISDHTLCPRYSALVLEGARVQPSPLWLQARLESVGLNAINNLVDVTNYVLAELPQPMHAFDADKLAGDTIYVRLARTGETLAALNGETYTLTEADLIIADAAGPIALAGVIGGAASAISETTKRVVLESANFQPSSVRLTSARHKLRTDASIRFEKSLDPQNTLRGLARAVEMLAVLAPGIHTAGGVVDNYALSVTPAPIVLPMPFVVRKLGKDVSQSEVTRILEALGFGVAESVPAVLTVTVPSWRATKDISIKDDLVEEIGRMVGYDSITPVPPLVASVVPPANPLRLYLRQVRDQLVALGFSEVHNYSFVTEAAAKRFHLNLSNHIAVRNPIASELTHMRQSLLPGLFESVITNVRNFPEFRLFEIGSEIHPDLPPSLPREVTHLAAALYNASGTEQDFFDLKRVVENLYPSSRCAAVVAQPYEHPTRTAQIEWRGTTIGRIFELHPALFQAEGLEGRAVLFDVDVSLAQPLSAAAEIHYSAPRKYPTSGFDLSVITALRTPVDRIQTDLSGLAGRYLTKIEFVRQYNGPPLQQGKKSVTYHLEIGAPDHTLTAEEMTPIRNHIIEGMHLLGYELRGA